MELDLWFPIVLLFSGCFLQLSLQVPGAAEHIQRMHPIAGSFKRMDRMSWIFIIVGTLWQAQNLLV